MVSGERLLEEMVERSWLFVALRLAGVGDRDVTVEQIVDSLEWAGGLEGEARQRCAAELRDLIGRAAEATHPTIEEQHELAGQAEEWSARWRPAGQPAAEPERRPGSAWRLRIDRPPLRHSPIVDGSERHLATVFSKLVVDQWFDLERTEEDRWRIRVGDLTMVVSVDGNGQASRVLVDTPPQPPPAEAGKDPAFRIRYVRLDGAEPAHLQVLDPQPDLVAALPTAGLWEAGGAWSILCGRGQDAAIEEVNRPAGVCRACTRELARIEAMVEDARWDV
ncbi:MAG: hypothetical protein ACRDZO_26860 [Egibacteraceae bacterium]